MKNNLYPRQGITSSESPLTVELEAIFDEIPEDDLAQAFKPYACGRLGYGWRTIWRTYVAMAYLNIQSFAELRRELNYNPDLRLACGITSRDGIPSKYAYSRFMRKMEWLGPRLAVKNVFRFLVKKLRWQHPTFGKSVAIDSTDLKAWSNGRHKIPTDKHAGWIAKSDNHGKVKWTWGFKAHVACDTETELPISLTVSPGNVHDTKRASWVLSEAKATLYKFNPSHVICDAGYSDNRLREVIRKKYRAQPIIKPNTSHKSAVADTPTDDPEWWAIYDRRTAVERLFGRLKQHRRLNKITVRGLKKVTVHCYMSLIVTNAMALAYPETPRQVVRAA